MAESRVSQELHIDPTLSLEDLRHHILLIELHEYSLSFIIVEPEAEIVVACGSYTSSSQGALNNIINSEAWLAGKTLKTIILAGGSRNTLVPSSLYKETEKAGYIDFNFEQKEKVITFTDDLPGQLSKNVYTIPYPVFLVISKTWPGSSIRHYSTPMIECMIKDRPVAATSASLIASVRDGKLAMIASSGDDLIYYNTFEYRTEEDALFYLLVAIDQLDLDPTTVNLDLCGRIFPGDDLHALFGKYIARIHFKPLPEMHYAKALKNIPGQLYVNLVYQAKCEL